MTDRIVTRCDECKKLYLEESGVVAVDVRHIEATSFGGSTGILDETLEQRAKIRICPECMRGITARSGGKW